MFKRELMKLKSFWPLDFFLYNEGNPLKQFYKIKEQHLQYSLSLADFLLIFFFAQSKIIITNQGRFKLFI